MDSVNMNCKNILMNYWSPCNQLKNQWEINPNKNKASKAFKKVQALKNIGDAFVQYICSQFEGDKSIIDKIINQFGQQNQIKGIQPKLLLGFCLHSELLKAHDVRVINSKINSIISNITKSSIGNTFSITISDSDPEEQVQDQQKISNFYAKSDTKSVIPSVTSNSQIQNIFDSQTELEDEISLNLNFQGQQNYDSDILKHQNQQVQQYLNKLSKSTTELSYLCQRMKWPQPEYIQNKSGVNQVLFSCKGQVMVRSKDKCYNLTGQCLYAVSKKQAKRVSSLFLLRKIYNRFPDSWKMFKLNRQQNPAIQQPLDANNQQIFKKALYQIFNLSIVKQEKKQNAQDQLTIEVNAYLNSINSYKAQFNVLIGKQKKITPPQFTREKIDNLSLWPVTVTLFDGDTRLVAEARDSSKKGAQEKCCRDLLFQIYTRNAQRWVQFVKYKKSKNL